MKQEPNQLNTTKQLKRPFITNEDESKGKKTKTVSSVVPLCDDVIHKIMEYLNTQDLVVPLVQLSIDACKNNNRMRIKWLKDLYDKRHLKERIFMEKYTPDHHQVYFCIPATQLNFRLMWEFESYNDAYCIWRHGVVKYPNFPTNLYHRPLFDQKVKEYFENNKDI